MAMKWSDEQLKAIEHGGHNILISAGAGSGKTAVLSERIYQLVKKGNNITRFLVLTFTNAAAMEMKSRVRDKILKDKDPCKHSYTAARSCAQGAQLVKHTDSVQLYHNTDHCFHDRALAGQIERRTHEKSRRLCQDDT